MVRLTDRPDMTLDVYRGRKTTMQQQQQQNRKRLKLLSVHICFSMRQSLSKIRARDSELFFMLNSAEHEILNAHKYKKYQEIQLFSKLR